MTGFSIVLILIAAAALFLARRGVRGANVAVILCVAGACGLAIFNFARKEEGSYASSFISDEQAAGNELARLLLADVKEGQVLLLRNPPLAGASREVSALRCEGVARACEKSGVQLIQAGPRFPGDAGGQADFIYMSEGSLREEVHMWATKNKEVRAVVSLLPVWPQVAFNGPVFAFMDASRDTSCLNDIRSGRVRAGIFYRMRPLPPETKPEANNGLPPKFILVTKENLDEAVKEFSF